MFLFNAPKFNFSWILPLLSQISAGFLSEGRGDGCAEVRKECGGGDEHLGKDDGKARNATP